jgi:hypothetical protein
LLNYRNLLVFLAIGFVAAQLRSAATMLLRSALLLAKNPAQFPVVQQLPYP